MHPSVSNWQIHNLICCYCKFWETAFYNGGADNNALLDTYAVTCSHHLAFHQDVVSDVTTTSAAHEGTTMTLSCLSGLVLVGSNTSTCMGNGQWEPDPRKVECMQIG